MAESRTIKRYANRKLYDTQRSRYVTLDQIADMIRAGEDVKILDNTSKEDLTSVTLAQIIFEEEKKRKSFLPLSTMRNIIQTSGESLQELASQAGARVRSVFRRGERDAEGEGDAASTLEGPDAPAPPSTETSGGPTPAAGAEGAAGPTSAVRELLERSQQTFDEWQKRVDERVHKVVEALAPWTLLQKEVTDLEQRIVDLEKRLKEQGG